MGTAAPGHPPAVTSPLIHCTAPSPIVYPEVLELEHTHCNCPFSPHEGKLAFTNDCTQYWAQSGINWATSDVSWMAASASIENAYINTSRRDSHIAMLQRTAGLSACWTLSQGLLVIRHHSGWSGLEGT